MVGRAGTKTKIRNERGVGWKSKEGGMWLGVLRMVAVVFVAQS